MKISLDRETLAESEQTSPYRDGDRVNMRLLHLLACAR